jgi:hypothetical protein
MATPLPSNYCRYNLTAEEELNGSILTNNQKYVLSNMLMDYVDQKENLTFDPTKPHEFMQQEAYKKGIIEILRHILDASEPAYEALQEMLREKRNTEN